MEQASKFDRLLAEPGWNDILAVMVERVNTTILSATRPPEHGESVLDNALGKTLQVTRWDAQRELLDSVRGHIKFIREERDRIREEELQLEHRGEYAGNTGE